MLSAYRAWLSNLQLWWELCFTYLENRSITDRRKKMSVLKHYCMLDSEIDAFVY